MKKVFSVLMVASVLSLVACKGNKTEEAAPAQDTTPVEAPVETPAADTAAATADTAAKVEAPAAEGEKKVEEHK